VAMPTQKADRDSGWSYKRSSQLFGVGHEPIVGLSKTV